MITQFAFRLICGLSVVWCIMPRSRVTSGFFRIQMLVTLGLAALAGISAGHVTSDVPALSLLSTAALQVIAAVIGGLSFVGSVFWTLERRTGGARLGHLIAVLSAVTVILNSVSAESIGTLTGTLFWLSELSTAGVSGAAVGGMLLGHWYLTAPTMSTSPLNRVNAWLGSCAVIRLLLGLIAGAVFAGMTVDDGAASSASLSSTHQVWLSLQWTGGIIGPLACSIMVHRILKYRNTQSATGVLFVGVILAFLGEMTGALLRNELRFPL